MFETRKELQSQLEASQAEITRLEAELATATARVDESATLSQQVAELTEDLEACKLELKSEKDRLDAARLEVIDQLAQKTAQLEAEQAKTTPEAIQALVTAEVCKAGIPPIDEPVATASKPDLKTMSREAFNQLSPRQRSEFSIKGGTITD